MPSNVITQTTYANVTKDDLVRKWRRMSVYTDFMPLVDEIPTYNLGDDLQGYTNYTLLAAMEELLLAQNDNLGPDLASMDGRVVIKRVPIMALKVLEDDTTNPLYFLNWGVFGSMGLRGEWMVESQIDKVAGQHTVAATHTDCSMNFICRDRRRNSVFSTNTTMPA